MALTRHFYRPDEVCAALSWCILNGRVSESIFWCLELIESELGADLVETLIETWAYSYGISFMIWLYRLNEIIHKDEITRDDFIELVGILAIEGKRNTKVLEMVAFGKIPSWNDIRSVLGSKETCIMFEESFNRFGPIARIVAGCFAECPQEIAYTSFRMPDETAHKIKEWDSLIGRRARREYKIPFDCLLFRTMRGYMTVYEDTLKELRCDLPKAFAGRSDFDRIFPDDIPDEWSKEDQEKSHSTGVLANKNIGKQDIMRKYLRRWYPGLSGAASEAIVLRGFILQK